MEEDTSASSLGVSDPSSDSGTPTAPVILLVESLALSGDQQAADRTAQAFGAPLVAQATGFGGPIVILLQRLFLQVLLLLQRLLLRLPRLQDMVSPQELKLQDLVLHL